MVYWNDQEVIKASGIKTTYLVIVAVSKASVMIQVKLTIRAQTLNNNAWVFHLFPVEFPHTKCHSNEADHTVLSSYRRQSHGY